MPETPEIAKPVEHTVSEEVNKPAEENKPVTLTKEEKETLCNAEIMKSLEKYNCNMVPFVNLEPSGMTYGIKIVSK